jgi:TRAP transporter TAXI family solute receptor
MRPSRATGPAIDRRTLVRALCAASVVMVAGCGEGSGYPPGQLRIASGARGGVYYAYGGGIESIVRRELPRLEPVVLPTAASIENLRLVASGGAEVGFTLADSATLAFEGHAPFANPLPVAALARLYDNYLHLVVRPESGVAAVMDLPGRAISLGPEGSGTELIASRLLRVAGLNVDADVRASRLSLDDSAAALATGHVDAFFFCGGIPTGAIETLARSMPIRLLDLGGFVPRMREQYGEFYAERTIPMSAYWLQRPVTTVGLANYLVVAQAMAEPLAYDLISVLFANRELLAKAHPEGRRLDRVSAINTSPLPLHPGAHRYYRQTKS